MPSRFALGAVLTATGMTAFARGMSTLAFTYVSYAITGSIAASVLTALAFALPSLFLAPVAARALRRYEIRLYMTVERLALATMFGISAVMVAAGWLSLGFLLVTSILNGVIVAFGAPANRQLIRTSIPDSGLEKVNGWLISAGAFGALAGILAGGYVYESLGTTALFVIAAIAFLPFIFAVWLLHPVRGTGSKASQHTHIGYRTTLETARNAFTEVPVLRAVVATQFLLVLLAWPVLHVLPAITHEVTVSAVAFSRLMACFYIGTSLASWLNRRQRTSRSHRSIMLQDLVVICVVLVGIAASGWISDATVHMWVLAVLVLLMGLMLGQSSALMSTALEAGAPAEARVSVFTVYSGANKILQMIAALGIAVMIDYMSTWLVIAIEGAGLIVLVVLFTRRSVLDPFASLDKPQGSVPLHSGHSTTEGSSWH